MVHVFITGASGYIGNGVLRELISHGHTVTGLTSAADKAAALIAQGAQAVIGSLEDPSKWIDQVANCDAFVHTAQAKSDSARQDQLTVDAIIKAGHATSSASKKKVFVYTSGCLCVPNSPNDAPQKEDCPTDNVIDAVAWRVPIEKHVLKAATPDFITSVIRPGFVWGGSSANSFYGMQFGSVFKTGVVDVIGEGTAPVNVIHVDDNAELYRLVVEKQASGIFHAVSGVTSWNQSAADVCKVTGKEVKINHISEADAAKSWGPFVEAFTKWRASAISTRNDEVGWNPKYVGFDAAVALKEMQS